MYAAILLTSACAAGYQPPAAAAPPAAAPVVVAAPNGGCVSTCADSCHRASLLDRIRARLHSCHHRDRCCDATPRCHAPREHHTWHAASSCNTCQAAPSCGPTCRTSHFSGHWGHKSSCGCNDSCHRANLWDTLRARFSCHSHRSHGCDGCGAPACGGCGAAPAPVVGGGTAPVPMGEKK